MMEIVASLLEGLSHRDVVLASERENRRKLLTAAGLAFRIVPAHVDEATIYDARTMRRQTRAMSPSYSCGQRLRR
jgi:predicted house-cleaning NTP pyrophosphatase (Maf/HAM1 superfamily)